MPGKVPGGIQTIIETLEARSIKVIRPTTKEGEPVYLINDHQLTERELRILAEQGELTSWGIFNFVRFRDQKGQ